MFLKRNEKPEIRFKKSTNPSSNQFSVFFLNFIWRCKNRIMENINNRKFRIRIIYVEDVDIAVVVSN